MTWQPTPQPHPWVPVAVGPPPAQPTEPREYHEFWKAPRYRWWRGLLALLMGGAIAFAISMVLSVGAMAYDISMGNATLENYTSLDKLKMTPMLFLANNLILASCIPAAYLSQWACTGQRPRWLSSVAGRFRWGWLLRCAAMIAPVYLVTLVIELALQGTEGLAVNPNTWFLVAAVVLTTPLQSAGEEFLIRGLLTRVVGSWLPRAAGVIVAAVGSAVVFMSLHLAQDPWLNTFYIVFGLLASLLVWRTGGLEAAIAMHAVNNLTGMVTLPFRDISNLFDRQAGVGDPTMLIQLAVMATGVALVLWQARRRNIQRISAPASAVPSGPPGWSGSPVQQWPGAGPHPRPDLQPPPWSGQAPPAPLGWVAGQGSGPQQWPGQASGQPWPGQASAQQPGRGAGQQWPGQGARQQWPGQAPGQQWSGQGPADPGAP